MTELTDRGKQFRTTLTGFIEARREAKLKGSDDAADTASKYEYTSWLTDAARRVGQIQAVTHVLKATHPDARGSSLHVRPDSLPPRDEVGSHALGTDFAEDVVGNAAALDVFKLLKLEVDGRRLLDWMQDGDPDLRAALHADSALAQDWMEAFGNLIRTEAVPASHEAAKQLYWLLGDDATDDAGYHLLQPMFSSSLAHAVHGELQEARFGEDNKAARQAFRNRQPHDAPYRDYRNLVARKLGGTKPQNISQLNSERGGINYLLASLPPAWDVERPRKLLNTDSAMQRLAWFDGVRDNVKQLADFLLRDPPANDATRTFRRRIEQELAAQLALYAAETWARTEPGWTRDEQCALPLHQKIWLDPARAEDIVRDPLDPGLDDDDREFHAAFVFGDWPDQVAGDFANWVNERLREAGLATVGDAEYRHWAKQAIVEAAWPVPMQRRAPKGAAA
ncbi:MAG: type I-F CRISPR-associated protein Csy1 [Stenotrophomonas sp.]